MNRVLTHTAMTIQESNSIFGFETSGTDAWPVWDRYLTIDGRRAYHIGNICGTCRYLFERLGGSTLHD